VVAIDPLITDFVNN